MNTEKITEDIQAVQDNIREIKSTWGNTIMTLDNIKSGLKADVQKKADEAYQRGYEDGKNSIHKGCEGCRYESKWQTENPCKDCSNCYKSQYEPMPKDEICFGDEIADEAGEKGVVVSRNNADKWIYALFKGYDVPQKIYKGSYRKTGVRRDLDSYFEEI